MSLSTRETILRLFAQKGVLTSDEISQALGISPVDVRYHLKALLKEKRIEKYSPELQSKRRVGRPPQQYRLSPTSHPENLEMLILSLLDQMSTFLPNTELWKKIAETIIPETPEQPFPSKLRHAMVVLERLHYEPRWEATQTGPKILFHCCPYASIWKHHSQICVMDRKILERLTGISFFHQSCMHKSIEHICVFLPEKPDFSSI
ncbi:hypothetical protein ANT_18250 [Anaerolinea thermophila UNI-1]|uniref:HTH arsR-type domain-containing protein n=2 Tax=Anaerolinea thermophila TaxID=167964 RepID=E8N5Y7_ANATU|nr:hypothetical protein ANT_18250 [Anaerolinea thermophila UNI-1]